MDAETRTFVRTRAHDRCEYCRLSQEHAEFSHHIEHVVAKQHGGGDEIENLALSCPRCNASKGPNLSGIDQLTGVLVPLFNPRRDNWHDHFAFRGPWIDGLTPVGRATVHVLAMNETRRLELRNLVQDQFETP